MRKFFRETVGRKRSENRICLFEKNIRCMSNKSTGFGPLDGYRVIEVGNFIAGPLVGTLLGYYGAEVIKIEPPGGDQVREYRDTDVTGTSWWWRSIGRNKKSIMLDLKQPKAQEIVKKLCSEADVFIENFKPGKIKEWNLDSSTLLDLNPDLVYCSVSGYGQTGPYSSRPGFASVCEAMGGLRYVNGSEPDENGNLQGVAIRPNLSIGDTLAGMNAAFGTLLALLSKERKKSRGQVVDTAIYESVFQLLEGCLPDYDGESIIRKPSGSTVTGIVPTGTYRTFDDEQVVIGGNSDTLFKRLMNSIGRPDMANSDEYDNNAKRVVHQKYIDSCIQDYTSKYSLSQVLSDMKEAKVPHGKIYSIKDIAEDEQYQARNMLEDVYVEELKRNVKIPALGTKLSATPGKTTWAGVKVGHHTDEILHDILKMSQNEIEAAVNSKALVFPSNYTSK